MMHTSTYCLVRIIANGTAYNVCLVSTTYLYALVVYILDSVVKKYCCVGECLIANMSCGLFADLSFWYFFFVRAIEPFRVTSTVLFRTQK